jgi:hypothetical protein
MTEFNETPDPTDDDAEGHVYTRDDADDTEGHVRKDDADDADDDVEGHRRV